MSMKTSGDFIQVRWKAEGDSGIPFQWPMLEVTPSQTHLLWDPMQGHQLKRARDIPGGTELTAFRRRSGVAGVRRALLRNTSTDKCHCFFVESFPHPASRLKWAPNLISLLTLLTLFTPLLPRFSETCPTQLTCLV